MLAQQAKLTHPEPGFEKEDEAEEEDEDEDEDEEKEVDDGALVR